MAQHHPSDDLLLAYASGSTGEAVSLLVATHLALCPICRAEVERLEALGGALVEELPPAPLPADLLQQVLSRVGRPEGRDPVAAVEKNSRSPATASATLLPRPLRDYVGGPLEGLAWRRRGGLSEANLLVDTPNAKTKLMRIKPGTAVPQHTHEGTELTLVLAGGFSDERGHYQRGDVAAADPSVTHRPVADEGEDCICLAVTDAPLKLTGPIGRLINPFIRL